MNFTREQLEATFDEWIKRVNRSPEEFETWPGYSEQAFLCADYLISILEELFPKPKATWLDKLKGAFK